MSCWSKRGTESMLAPSSARSLMEAYVQRSVGVGLGAGVGGESACEGMVTGATVCGVGGGAGADGAVLAGGGAEAAAIGGGGTSVLVHIGVDSALPAAAGGEGGHAGH